MTECLFCDIIEGKKEAKRLYEDDKVIAVLAEKPSALGHVQVILKSHASLFKKLETEVVQHFFWTASYAASSIFEYFGVQGTNIILHEGLTGQEHLVLHVIPRKFDDGLDFQWLPKEYTEQENATAFEKLKDKAFFIGKGKQEGKNKEGMPKEEAPAEAKTRGEKQEEKPGRQEKHGRPEENYQIKRLVRIP